MKHQSQPNKNSKTEIYTWIERSQKHNDEQAQVNLIRHYQGLVDSIARKYAKSKELYEDLYQVGMVGLLGAIQRYDETFGKSFEAFAIPTIVGEIKRFLRDKTWSIHVPRRIKELGPKIMNTAEQLEKELGKSPSVNEIADYLGISEEEVLEAMEIGKSYRALSVDHAIEADQDGNTVTLLDLVGKDEEGFEKVNQRLSIEKVLHVLNKRERMIIHYTFMENLSQKECGEKLGISQMHVSRLLRKAIQKLKTAADGLEDSECKL